MKIEPIPVSPVAINATGKKKKAMRVSGKEVSTYSVNRFLKVISCRKEIFPEALFWKSLKNCDAAAQIEN